MSKKICLLCFTDDFLDIDLEGLPLEQLEAYLLTRTRLRGYRLVRNAGRFVDGQRRYVELLCTRHKSYDPSIEPCPFKMILTCQDNELQYNKLDIVHNHPADPKWQRRVLASDLWEEDEEEFKTMVQDGKSQDECVTYLTSIARTRFHDVCLV